MKHLSIDQIIDFVSLTALDHEAVKLSVTVNGHIRGCQKCLERVRAFQMVYDEFENLHANQDFEQYIAQNYGSKKQIPDSFR